MWSITKKNHCTLVTFTTAVLGLSDSLPQIFIVETFFFSLNLAPGFFHISKKEDFTVIWTLLTCLAFIGICKNAVTDVKKVMDVTNCRILFAVVGSSGYLLNSTALWNFWINVKTRVSTLYQVDLFQIGICKNVVTDVKKVMDVTNCRILFAVVGSSSGYLLNSTAFWNSE